MYDAVVGRACVQFVIRWQSLGDRYDRYTMEYTPGGVGNILMDDLRLRVAFLVYTVPVRSMPAGASHRLRVWLKTRRDDPSAGALDDSYVYQRVWRSDMFKIGARLNFEVLGPRIVMGSPAGSPQTAMMEAVGLWSTA